ncbi:MAG: ribonuclease P protein component [Clostridia bacterium]|nr:ribonuclease P protein component [Clostridia bacterium]
MQYLRLKKNGDFLKLFKKGKRVYSDCLTVIYSPAKTCVMGIALTKKHGKAVKRNRIKRLIRAAFANNLKAVAGNYKFVIMPKVQDSYTYAEIERSLLYCFKRLEK